MSGIAEKSGSFIKSCLGKILSFILVIFVITFARTCSRQSMEKNDASSQLEQHLEETKRNLPIKIDEITTLKDVKIDGSYFYYIYDLNDSKSSLSSINDSEFRNILKQDIQSNISSMGPFIKALTKTDRGIIYRYHGTSSGITKDAVISENELFDMWINAK